MESMEGKKTEALQDKSCPNYIHRSVYTRREWEQSRNKVLGVKGCVVSAQ